MAKRADVNELMEQLEDHVLCQYFEWEDENKLLITYPLNCLPTRGMEYKSSDKRKTITFILNYLNTAIKVHNLCPGCGCKEGHCVCDQL